MNSKARIFIKNFSYTLTSNLISLIISTLVVLIVPKLINVEQYGYWQIYIFYSSYVGFMQLGWNDGIYLRYGGKEYDSLNKQIFFSQFWMLLISQVIIAIFMWVLISIFIKDINKVFIFNMTALCMIIVGVRAMLLFILEGSNRIKHYAQITIIDRVVYCILISMFLIWGIRQYKLMIVGDLIGKFVSLLYAIYICKDIVFNKISKFYFDFREAIENINVGAKLMVANIASMLIIGVVRMGIEAAWDVETFGKISLTLSISNLMMIFINAIGIIMFPILKRADKDKLSNIYITLNEFLMMILLGLLIAYYPFKITLSRWLPIYSESLMYMALVFPICIFEGKMALIINTYLKALRKEKIMLKINLVSLILSIILTFITTDLIFSLDLSIIVIVIVLAFRCVIAEICIGKFLGISKYKDIILELLMVIIFIVTGWYMKFYQGIIIYMLFYATYIFIKRKDIMNTIKGIKLLMKLK